MASSRRPGAERARRLLDLVASTVGLVALAPFFAVVAVAIRVDSPGPVFYRAERVGRRGRRFRMFKFRTMRDAGDRGARLTRDRDPRITWVGAILRRTKIDELPQLIDVFRGTMSLVGPRPEDPRYVERYDSRYAALLETRPGMTSPASLEFRDESVLLAGEEWERVYVEQILPRKLEMELHYLQRRTMVGDLLVMARTVLALVTGKARRPDGCA